MSWSVSAIGKPGAVASKVQAELSASKCCEPEEGVKQAAAVAILAALNAQDRGSVVRVSASGHQSTNYGPDGKPVGFQNTLDLKIEPIYGFIE